MSTRTSAGVDDCPCFTTFYCYDPYRLQNYNFFLTLVYYNNFNIGELTSATSKERMTMNIIFVDATKETITTNIIFAGATPIN